MQVGGEGGGGGSGEEEEKKEQAREDMIHSASPAENDSLEEQDVATDGDDDDGDELSSAAEKGLGRLRRGGQVDAVTLTNVGKDSAVVDKDGGEGEGGFAEIERSVEHTLGPSDSGLIQDGECVNPPEKETLEQNQGQSVDTGGLDAREEYAADVDTENKQGEPNEEEELSEKRDDVSAGDGDMMSKEQEPDEEDEEEILKALMGADSGISEELEEDSRSSSIDKADSESGDSSANVNQDTDALSDLKSTAVAFKPAKTASLDLAVVLERIKRKADQATVSRDVCEEEEEQGTRVSMEDVEREDDIGDQEDGFMIDTAEDTILPASIPKDILKRLEEKCTNRETSSEQVNLEQDEQCLDGSEIKAGKPDENSEDHNESAERDTKEDEDSQDEEEQDSGCSSDPESCSTDDSDEADKEEREFLEETRLLRQIEKDDMNSCNELEFRSQLSGSFLVEELMDNSRSRPLSNPMFQLSGKGSAQTPNRSSVPTLGKTKKKQVTRTLLDTSKSGLEEWAALARASSLNNQTLSKPTAPKRSRIFVYSSNEGSKDAGSRGHSQTRQAQEDKAKANANANANAKSKESNASRPKKQSYHGKRSLFELVTSQDQASRPDNASTLSELNSALGHVRKAVTGPR